jgi:hypothetical protein
MEPAVLAKFDFVFEPLTPETGQEATAIKFRGKVVAVVTIIGSVGNAAVGLAILADRLKSSL